MHYTITFLSVILGFIFAILIQPKNKTNLKLLLSFSGSFLLSLTIMHLLPEVYEGIESHRHHAHEHTHNHSFEPSVEVFIMIGILFQIVLEFFSKGAEHGHVHLHRSMQQIPWALFISLSIHAFLEGMPISQHHEMAWGIGIHHFPIAIILTLFFAQANLSKARIIFFMIMFAIMTPLGTLLAENLHFLQHYKAEISALVIGILFHIASTIIFETNEHHTFNIYKLISIILGFVLAMFI